MNPNVKPVITCNSTIFGQPCTMVINFCYYLTIKGIHFKNSSPSTVNGNSLVHMHAKFNSICCYFEYINVDVASPGYVNNCNFYRSSYVTTADGETTYFNGASIIESYVEGKLQITDSFLKDSAVELSFSDGISSTGFSGSFRLKDRYLPQVVINNKHTSGGGLEIVDCNFTNAVNGVIASYGELETNVVTVMIHNSNFTNNKANKGTGIIGINISGANPPYFEIFECTFEENDATNIKISNFNSNTFVLYTITIRISMYGPENFNPVSISNSSSLILVKNFNFQCPINTIVEFDYQKGNFDYFCIPIKGNQYSALNAKLTMDNNGSSFQKTIPPIFKCPDVAVCSVNGIESKGNHWGRVVNGEIHFVPCPSFHCCRSIEDCQSYDTCRNRRTGELCGECPDGFAMSIFSQYGCVRVDKCDNDIVWLLMILFGAFVTILFTYPEKMFKLLDFLKTIEETKREAHNGYREMRQHHDNKPQMLGARSKDIDGQKSITNNEITSPGEPSGSAITRDSEDAGNNQHLEEIDHSNETYCQETDGSNEISCQGYPDELAYITNERPAPNGGKLHSSQGMIKTLLYFYQTVGLLLLNNSVTSQSLLPTEILSSVFSIKLQVPSMEYDACLFATRNAFVLEVMKLSIFFASLALIIFLITCLSIYKEMRPRRDEHNRNELCEVIDEKVDDFQKPSILLRLKSAYVQVLCYGYTAVTVLIFHNIHYVTIENDSVMFLDASIKCSTRKSIFMVCALLILCWCVMFILALYIGFRWLSRFKITYSQFLVCLTVPPILFVFWIRIRKAYAERKLRYSEAKCAKYLLKTISGAYRLKEKTLRGEPQTGIVWDCIYLLRCFAMSLACVLPNKSLDRLLLVCAVMLFFLVLHLHAKPFKIARVNQIELCSSVSLILMAFSCFIMNSHVESAIIEEVTNVFIVLSFAPVIAYVAFLLSDLILMIVVNWVAKIFKDH